jgi:hypothetical protein
VIPNVPELFPSTGGDCKDNQWKLQRPKNETTYRTDFFFADERVAPLTILASSITAAAGKP